MTYKTNHIKTSYVIVKTIRIIQSCKTLKQLQVAEKYCARVQQLMPKKYKDFSPDFQLILKNKQKSIEERQYFDNIDNCLKLDSKLHIMIEKMKNANQSLVNAK